MSKILCLHFGQAGIQLGNAFWELICIEHAISPDGTSLAPYNSPDDENNKSSLFDFGNLGNHVPRAVLIDSESSVINEVKTGAYRQLFNSQQMIHDKEDAANNYARGSYTIGRKIIKSIGNGIRRVVEHTDNLRSFFLFSSSGGGTGSGISPLVLLYLMKNYPKAIRNNFSLVPGGNFISAVVEPYNMCLQNFSAVDTTDINFLFDNESMYDVCRKKLFMNAPTFTEVNRILAMIFSCVSCPLRFASVIHSAIDDLVTNLIPYPRIHYPIVRFAPMNHMSRTSYDKISTYELTKELFSKDTQSLKIDTNKGMFIAMVLNYQGNVQSKDIYRYIEESKFNRGNKFVDWCPTGYKVGICSQVPSVTPMLQIAPTDQYANMLFNSTAISEFFHSISRKFDALYSRRSFLHWFIEEGMEEIEFQEARNEIEMLNGDFKEIAMDEGEILKYANEDSTRSCQMCSFRNNSNFKSRQNS